MSEAAAQALPYILGGLVVAALLAYVLTPLAGRIARHFGAVDRPGAASAASMPGPSRVPAAWLSGRPS